MKESAEERSSRLREVAGYVSIHKEGRTRGGDQEKRVGEDCSRGPRAPFTGDEWGLRFLGLSHLGNQCTMGAPPVRDESKVGFVLQHLQPPRPQACRASKAEVTLRLSLGWPLTGGWSLCYMYILHLRSQVAGAGQGSQRTGNAPLLHTPCRVSGFKSRSGQGGGRCLKWQRVSCPFSYTTDGDVNWHNP